MSTVPAISVFNRFLTIEASVVRRIDPQMKTFIMAYFPHMSARISA